MLDTNLDLKSALVTAAAVAAIFEELANILPDGIVGSTDGANETGMFFHCPMELSYRTISLFCTLLNLGTNAPFEVILE